MATSIIVLLLIGAIVSGVGAILSNLARVSELREVKRELRRYEQAFRVANPPRSAKIPTCVSKPKEPTVTLRVVDEKDGLPKFGDE